MSIPGAWAEQDRGRGVRDGTHSPLTSTAMVVWWPTKTTAETTREKNRDLGATQRTTPHVGNIAIYPNAVCILFYAT